MGELAGPPKVELCVFCGRHPVEPAWRPFCSARCKTQDLARWADGTYRVPGPAAMDAKDTEEGTEQDTGEDTQDENG